MSHEEWFLIQKICVKLDVLINRIEKYDSSWENCKPYSLQNHSIHRSYPLPPFLLSSFQWLSLTQMVTDTRKVFVDVTFRLVSLSLAQVFRHQRTKNLGFYALAFWLLQTLKENNENHQKSYKLKLYSTFLLVLVGRLSPATDKSLVLHGQLHLSLVTVGCNDWRGPMTNAQ